LSSVDLDRLQEDIEFVGSSSHPPSRQDYVQTWVDEHPTFSGGVAEPVEAVTSFPQLSGSERDDEMSRLLAVLSSIAGRKPPSRRSRAQIATD
jgi:hypothetical protein